MTWQARFDRLFALLPSALSVSRILIGMAVPFLFFSPDVQAYWLAGLLLVIGVLTDYLDGAIARRFNLVSNWGKILDPTADKFLILVPLAAFVAMGLFSPWWLVPVFFREIVVTFLRLGWFLEGQAVGAEKLGKWKFAAQVLTLVCAYFAFWVLHTESSETARTVFRFLLPLALGLTVLLTVVSGWSFLKANRSLFQSEFFFRYASALGVGLIPGAPGTWGSLLGLGMVLLVHWNALLMAAVFGCLVAAGHWAVSRLDLSVDSDPAFVVVDEACGIFLAFFLVPLSLASVLTGFFLFRLFDILKPFPLRRLERLKGYWGILGDDLGAGFYAWILMLVMFR